MKKITVEWNEKAPNGVIIEITPELNDLDLLKFTIRMFEDFANNEEYGAFFRKTIIETAQNWYEKDREIEG